MIRYGLACDDGHEFDSWFPSAASYDGQAAGGLVTCPVCGSDRVSKRVMAPAIGAKSSGQGARSLEPASQPEATPQPVAILSEKERAVRAMFRAVREHVVKTADYVGPGFAEEARRMHHGEIDHRSIYGEASPVEAQALREEGIEVHALPIAPDDRN